MVRRPAHASLLTWLALVSGACGNSVRHASRSDGSGGVDASAGGSRGGVAGTTGGVALGGSSGGGGSAGTSAGTGSGDGPGDGGASEEAGSSGTAGGSSDGASGDGGSSAGGAEFGGAGGVGGSPATEVDCVFEISGEISPTIATVGVIDWSTDLGDLTGAKIEFSLNDPEPGELNVESGGPISVSGSRALMLGLKPDRAYTYRLVATAGDRFCKSEDQSIRTRPDPDAPVLARAFGESETARANGFIVTCSTYTPMIVDADGEVVWWGDAPAGCVRAHMDWDGEHLWTANGNPGPNDSGSVSRLSMDGSGAEEIAGLERSHHDFAVLPGGIAAFLVWTHESDRSSELIERMPDGTLRSVATLSGDTLRHLSTAYHANALRYYASDDSYTVGDLYLPGISKLSRTGELEWQVRSSCALDSCAAVDMWGTHGHQLLENGNLLFFAATETGVPSPVFEYGIIDDGGWLTATLEWTYASEAGSKHWGDVQRLSNGNTLVTYSMAGTIHEVSPEAELIQSLTNGSSLGYATFRETLYGPPQ